MFYSNIKHATGVIDGYLSVIIALLNSLSFFSGLHALRHRCYEMLSCAVHIQKSVLFHGAFIHIYTFLFYHVMYQFSCI